MRNKILAVIDNRNQIDKLNSVIKIKNSESTELKIFALNYDIGKELASRGLESKTPEDYELSKEAIRDEPLKWFRSWPDNKIKSNKNIKESLSYENKSIWWFLDGWLYLSSFCFDYSIRDILKYALILEHVIGIEKPARIWCAESDTPACRIIGLICQSRGIALTIVPHSFHIRRRLYRKLKEIVFIYGQWLRIFLRKTYSLILGCNPTTKIAEGKRKVLIFSGDNWKDVYDPTTGKLGRGDIYFDSVIKILTQDKNTEVAFMDVPCAFYWGVKTMKEKKLRSDMIYKPFESYLKRDIISKAWKVSGQLCSKYESLANSRNFKQSLNFNGIPLHILMEPNLSFAFSRGHLLLIITIAEIAKHMVETEKPDIIVVCGEISPFERPVIAAGKVKGLPILSMQHGVLAMSVPHYYHIEKDIDPNGEANTPYCPMADKVAVYGKESKDILVKRAKFAEKDVIISGQPRYDILARASEVFDREETFRKLDLELGKKLLVWTTNTRILSTQENQRDINIVYRVIKLLDNDIQLVVKLHPIENQKAPLFRKGKSFRPIIVGGVTITPRLLSAADIVLSLASTTVQEAIMLNKPVIVMDFGGKLASSPYIESGAAIAVYEEDSLIAAIKDILYDEEVQRKLGDARKRFVHEHGYLQNGQASKTVADLIIQMTMNKKGQ